MIIVMIIAAASIFFSTLALDATQQTPGSQPMPQPGSGGQPILQQQTSPVQQPQIRPNIQPQQFGPIPTGNVKAITPRLVKFDINRGVAVATNDTVTLDFSTAAPLSKRPEDIEGSKPTHYRWKLSSGFPYRCEVGTAYAWSNWTPVHPGITPFARLQRYCQSRNNGVNRDQTLRKGLCGMTTIQLQVKNSAGESNVMEDRIDFISESEFIISGSTDLLKSYKARVVSSSFGSSCKVYKKLKQYVQGVEELSGIDELALHGLTYGYGLDEDANFYATGATPANGSKCEYELYPKMLPAGWSVVKFNTYCYSHPINVQRGSWGCETVKSPSLGSRDLTTRVRVWTDAQKAPGVWAMLYQWPDTILKGDCRGLNEPGSPSMD
jgi:hypothetical protein